MEETDLEECSRQTDLATISLHEFTILGEATVQQATWRGQEFVSLGCRASIQLAGPLWRISNGPNNWVPAATNSAGLCRPTTAARSVSSDSSATINFQSANRLPDIELQNHKLSLTPSISIINGVQKATMGAFDLRKSPFP